MQEGWTLLFIFTKLSSRNKCPGLLKPKTEAIKYQTKDENFSKTLFQNKAPIGSYIPGHPVLIFLFHLFFISTVFQTLAVKIFKQLWKCFLLIIIIIVMGHFSQRSPLGWFRAFWPQCHWGIILTQVYKDRVFTEVMSCIVLEASGISLLPEFRHPLHRKDPILQTLAHVNW